jgi:ribosomal protein S18 acetylase RimI-like enzyme
MQIRTATQGDAAALARLIEEFNSDYRPIVVTREQAAARLAATAGVETTFVAAVNDTIAGFACLRLVPYMSGDEPYAELTDLFVAARFRRRGVGQALIRRVEQVARERGAAEVIILTGHDNAAAQSLYRSLGYGDYAIALRRRLADDKE